MGIQRDVINAIHPTGYSSLVQKRIWLIKRNSNLNSCYTGFLNLVFGMNHFLEKIICPITKRILKLVGECVLRPRQYGA